MDGEDSLDSKENNISDSDELHRQPEKVGLVSGGHHNKVIKLDEEAKEQAESKETEKAAVKSEETNEASEQTNLNADSDQIQSEDLKETPEKTTPKDGSEEVAKTEDGTKASPNETTEEIITIPDIPIKSQKILLYRNKPIFGLDIGYDSIKVMQVKQGKHGNFITGYGTAKFDPAIIKDGVISDPKSIALVLKNLLETQLVGKIETNRAVMSIPAPRTFMRSVVLPADAEQDLHEAVRLEIEQYIPTPLSDSYMDFSVIKQSAKDVQLLVASVPKKIADPYLAVTDELDLEVIAIEPTLLAVSRLYAKLNPVDLPTVLVDFGAVSSDVIVYDKGVISAGSVPGGGETLSKLIAGKIHTNQQETHEIKTEYGIGSGYIQQEIWDAIRPELEQIVQEMKRVMRYYEEHFDNKQIQQIVLTGGGSNLLGLNEYLTSTLHVPTRTFVPWQVLKFDGISTPDDATKSTYITAAGLALLSSEEIFS